MHGWLVVLLTVGLQSDSAKAAPVLDRASAAYRDVKVMAADFVQIVTNPLTGAPDTTFGRFYQLPPNRLGMRFTVPRGDRIVADGRYFWLYTPSTTPGQVIRTRIPATGGQGPNLIGQFTERPHERYTSRYVRGDSLPSGPVDVLLLVPRDTTQPFSEATLWVDRKDALPRRIEFQETSGQKRTITLSNLTVNGAIPWREFTFAIPAGAQVVDQEEDR
jgi:outer membrane lipoprotein carrier protein